MLKSLYVKNFVLIDEVELNFYNGMSSFTGETGAGKSILLDAISLLAGGRSSSSIVRNGTSKAIVEGVFESVAKQSVLDALEEAGIDMSEGQLIVRREISSDGRSVARMNQTTVTASFLKDVISQILDLHSQHETQYLLQAKYHQELLDAYLANQALLDQVASNYKLYKKYKDELDEALKTSYNEDDLDFFTAQLNEIDEHMLEDNEEEELDQKLKEASIFEQTIEEIQESLSILEGERQVVDGLYEGASVLKHAANDELHEISERLINLHYQIEEEVATLHKMMENEGFDNYEVESMHERKNKIISMKKKYGNEKQDWLDKKASLEDSISFILRREHYISEMEFKIQEAYDIYKESASKLHDERVDASKRLEEDVVKQLQGVQLENARFGVSIEQTSDTKYGFDDIRFMISMNPGEALAPLHKVASGGELSRFMLAMKVIFTRLQGIETVIFDEIDTGVSGNVAHLIGLKMNELASSSQVFAVTHLAPVAACAKHQYQVSKEQDSESTHTYVSELDLDERIDELALMASGTISDASKATAKELFESSQK